MRTPEVSSIWLKFDIWDAFANHNHEVSFKAAHWRLVLDGCPDDQDERIPGRCQYPGCSERIDVMRYCIIHAEAVVMRARQQQETIEGGVQ